MSSTDLVSLLSKARVVPVITVEDSSDAVALAMALRDGGLPVLEVTLRTAAALDAVKRITREVSGVFVGAGTIRTERQLIQAQEAGAAFAVSPGSTPELLQAAARVGVPLIPGAATPSEVMRLSEAGISLVKFFPAEASGAADAIRALGGPFPEVMFCPTGGIDLDRAQDYLALPNVACVGGSWMVPRDAVANRDWNAVGSFARATSDKVAA